jgi:hypothetical protein
MSATDLKNAQGKRKKFRVTVDHDMGWMHLHKCFMNYFYIKWGQNNNNWFTDHQSLYEAMIFGESISNNEGGHYYQISDTDECTVLYFDSEEEFKQHFIEYFI